MVQVTHHPDNVNSTVIITTLLCVLPESPVFLLSKGKDKAAKESLQWLRGTEYNTTEELEQVTYQAETEVPFIASTFTPDEDKCST